jgi:hypothetical protein
MIRIRETIRTLPYYRPVPLTPLPLIYQREHLFPYATYGDTCDSTLITCGDET